MARLRLTSLLCRHCEHTKLDSRFQRACLLPKTQRLVNDKRKALVDRLQMLDRNLLSNNAVLKYHKKDRKLSYYSTAYSETRGEKMQWTPFDGRTASPSQRKKCFLTDALDKAQVRGLLRVVLSSMHVLFASSHDQTSANQLLCVQTVHQAARSLAVARMPPFNHLLELAATPPVAVTRSTCSRRSSNECSRVVCVGVHTGGRYTSYLRGKFETRC